MCGRDMQILCLQPFLRVTVCRDLLLSWLYMCAYTISRPIVHGVGVVHAGRNECT